MTKKKRDVVWLKFDGRCAYCGHRITLPKDRQVDHIRPKRHFYSGDDVPDYHHDDFENLNPACRFCNNWKSEMTVEEFREEIEAQVDRARKYSRNFRMAERYGMVEVTKTKIQFHFERYGETPK